MPSGEGRHVFYCRKGFPAINTMFLVDANGKILHVDPQWPGSTHDSRVLTESDVDPYLSGFPYGRNSMILGDSGYKATPWCLTPYRESPNLTPAQRRYNRIHKRSRVIVEQSLGVLKRTFSILKTGIRMSPERCSQVIKATAALYNFRKIRQLPDYDDQQDEDLNVDEESAEINNENDQAGLAFRNSYVLSNF